MAGERVEPNAWPARFPDLDQPLLANVAAALNRSPPDPYARFEYLGDEMKPTALTLLIAALAASALAAPATTASAQPAPTPAQAPAAAEAATPILPGYWDYTTRMLGIPVDHKKKCLNADEVEDFLTRPCNRHHTCVYPTKQVGGGKLLLDGYWQNKEGKRARVRATGTYSPKAFTIRANGTSTQGIPIGATLQAKWLGAECPAEHAGK
jgi:hypothetical protein